MNELAQHGIVLEESKVNSSKLQKHVTKWGFFIKCYALCMDDNMTNISNNYYQKLLRW